MNAVVPKPSKDTVYVDVDDEITAIIEKVDGAHSKVVALVLPKRTTALKSIVNMRLLKRSAENAGKSVVLITSEHALLPLAGAAGVHVSKSLHSKPEIPPSPLEKAVAGAAVVSAMANADGVPDATRPIGELAMEHEGDPIDLDDEDQADTDAGEKKPKKPPKDKKLRVPDFDRFRLLMFAGILGVAALIFVLIFGTFVWPRATITIQTESTPISANFTLDATDKAKVLDEVAGTIPAVLKTADQTASTQVQATGQQNNGTKATGSVTLTNCSNSPATVPAGTGVSTNGLTYITQTSVSLDSGNFTGGGVCKSSGSHVGSTNVTAQQGGTKYNTSLSGASVAGYPGVSASGSAAGGTDNNITVVSQADVDGAKQKAITDQSAADFTKNFEAQLASQGLYVITSTLKAGPPLVTATPGVGQPASTSNVTVKVTYSVLTVQKSDLAKAITDQLQKQINTKEQKISSNDVVKGASVTVQSSGSPGEASISVSESTTAVPTLDVVAIEKQAGGLKSADIRAFISNYPGVKSVDVKMSPFWVSKAPKKPAKVHIILKQVKSS